MHRLRLVPLPLAAFMLLSACGNDPAGGVAVPGAPPAVTTVVARTTAPAPTTTLTPPTTTAATSTTTTAPPATAPTTTTPEPTTTPAPSTTDVAAPTTVPGPTTTALVYVEESATGTLRFGMEGPRSLQLQRDLIRLGFLPPGADDGLYGPGTAGGVRRFQESVDLIIDGVAGPVTQSALAEAIAAADADPPPDE